MSRSDWEEIRDVIKGFQDCEKGGKDFVEAMTGLLWFERQRNDSLCAALEEIFAVARAALDAERPASSRLTNLLQMVIDPETGLPSRNQVECTLMWDGQRDPLHEVPAEKDCNSDQRQHVSRDTTKL